MWSSRRGLKEAQDAIDLRALEQSTEAKAMVKAHQDFCDRDRVERARREDQFRQEYAGDTAEVKGSIKEVHGRVTGLRTAIWTLVLTVGGFIIALGIGIIGYLLVNDKPWQIKPPPQIQIIIPPESINELRK